MLTNVGQREAISSRDKLSEEAYQELSFYYRGRASAPVIKLDSHRSDLLLDELEKECSHKVQD